MLFSFAYVSWFVICMVGYGMATLIMLCLRLPLSQLLLTVDMALWMHGMLFVGGFMLSSIMLLPAIRAFIRQCVMEGA